MSDAAAVRRPRFFRRVTVWLPTWRLWLPALILGSTVAGWLLCSIHGFLSVHAPVPARLLVVEGWLPEYALREAVAEFQRGGYEYLIASGGPMERGSLVSGYATYAAIAGETLRRLGVPADRVLEAPAARTYRHRTYQSAVQVRELLRERNALSSGLNVLSAGTHARRTWTVYRKVFGTATSVGVLEVPSQEYDAKRWWTSSEGVKSTITETMGWGYEILFDGGREE